MRVRVRDEEALNLMPYNLTNLTDKSTNTT
jgi:hypothetical protein